MKRKKTKPTNKRKIYIALGIFFVLLGFAIPFYLIVGALFLWLAWRANKDAKKTEPAPAPAVQAPKQVTQAAPVVTAPVTPAAAPDADKWKTYKVTGMQHYMANIMTLAMENDDYKLSKRDLVDQGLIDERVYQYDFCPLRAELVQEPDNPVDPNAIKVLVDGLHVGYIKAGSCAHLNKVIRENRIEEIRCAMGGGGYKFIAEDYDDYGRETYTMEKDKIPFWVHLTIKEGR